MKQDEIVDYFVHAPIAESRETLAVVTAVLKVREALEAEVTVPAPAKRGKKTKSRNVTKDSVHVAGN